MKTYFKIVTPTAEVYTDAVQITLLTALKLIEPKTTDVSETGRYETHVYTPVSYTEQQIKDIDF